MLCIAVCLAAATAAFAADNCRVCHRLQQGGVHARLACSACHGTNPQIGDRIATAASGASGCTSCHSGYGEMFRHAMTKRSAEKAFAQRAFGAGDKFFSSQCGSCHVKGCLDCHGPDAHAIARPSDERCHGCHRGYFIGADYHGRAPREESLRYQRGPLHDGEHYLSMLPDIHAERGIPCRRCHTMGSFLAGKPSAKGCRDCHQPDRSIVEHRIAAHLQNMECQTCHAAWTAQEYGTFYIRIPVDERDQFYLRETPGPYLKSVYLKKQDAPPLGINISGKVSPIRPQFIMFVSDSGRVKPVEQENRLLAAEWKAVSPHTIRRGTVPCEGCHDVPRRFLLEPPAERLYDLAADGLPLGSFWDRTGQRVVNGGFMPQRQYQRVAGNGPVYQKAYIEAWQRFINRVGASSAP